MMKKLLAVLLLCLLPTLVCAQFQWSEHLIIDDPSFGVAGLSAADLDQDGDQDLITTASYDGMSWWENDGAASFTEHELTSGDFFTARAAEAADLDGDGDLDIIFGGDEVYEMHWWENDGTQNFTLHYISQMMGSMFSVTACDLDGDGDMDVVGSGMGFNSNALLCWYENDGAQGFTRHPMDTNASIAFSSTGDIDNDGDIDILCCQPGDPVELWYNDGLGSFTEVTLGIEFEMAVLADVNCDGDCDILGSYVEGYPSSNIVWLEAGFSMTEHLIGSTNNPSEIFARDFDADGDMDVVCATNDDYYEPGDPVWENLDGDGLSWSETIIESAGDRIPTIYPADLDCDGDVDVFGVPDYSHALMWWELLGTPPEPEPVIVALTPATDPVTVEQGESFEYAALVQCNLPGVTMVDLWTEAVLPSGYTYGPIWTLDNLSLPSGATVQADAISQSIPVFAPLGTYTFRLNAGMRPGYVAGFDEFTFDVVAPTATSSGNQHWSASGYQALAGVSDNAADINQPVEFALLEAYPNPFNPTTTISVAMPSAADLTVTVVNTLGQQVAELTNGRTAAGTHAFIFDASSLASGIYFVHATVPGELNAVQKAVLMK